MSNDDLYFKATVMAIEGPHETTYGTQYKAIVRYENGQTGDVWAGGHAHEKPKTLDAAYLLEVGVNGTVDVKWRPSHKYPGEWVQYLVRPSNWAPSQRSMGPPTERVSGPSTTGEQPPSPTGPSYSDPKRNGPPSTAQERDDESPQKPQQPAPPASTALSPADLGLSELQWLLRNVRVAAMVTTHALVLAAQIAPDQDPIEVARLIRDYMISADKLANRARPNGAVHGLSEIRNRARKLADALDREEKGPSLKQEHAVAIADHHIGVSHALFNKDLDDLTPGEHLAISRWLTNGTGGLINEAAIVTRMAGGGS